jgi:hypothetical protein
MPLFDVFVEKLKTLIFLTLFFLQIIVYDKKKLLCF